MSTLVLNEEARASSSVSGAGMFGFVLPALAAIAYPLLLSAITFLLQLFKIGAPPSPATITVTVLAILASASAVMGIAFARALSLGRAGAWAAPRLLAHLVFAVPTLLVAFGNVVGLFHARGVLTFVWPLFWLAVTGVAWLAQDATSPAIVSSRRLAVAHGISAVAILILFLVPHLGNHLTGIVSGADHFGVMKLVRLVYRNAVIEPLLVTLIGFQIMSGFVLVRRRLSRASDFFGTVQTMTGIYVACYFLGHMTAVFAARGAGTDTNWNWLTSDDHGLLFHLSSFSLVGHYWVGPIAIVTHVACGLRMVMLGHGVSGEAAARTAWGLIGLGVVASSVILAGLLGAHVA
jgi:hypothetical protein